MPSVSDFGQTVVMEADREAAVADAVVELSVPEQRFVLEYLNCWNVRKAGMRCGWSAATARVYGYQMMKKPAVQQAIQGFMEARGISAGVVLDQLAEIASADFADFMVYDPNTRKVRMDLAQAYEQGATHLIKKVRVTKGSIEIELHDKVAVLGLLARHFGLLNDKQSITLDWRNELSGIEGANPDEVKTKVKDVIRGLIAASSGTADS